MLGNCLLDAFSPALLLLDEPFAGLDPPGKRQLVSFLEELRGQIGVLFSLHDLYIVFAHAQRVVGLKRVIVSDAAPGSSGTVPRICWRDIQRRSMSRVPRLMKAVAYKEWRGLLARGLAGRLGFAFLFPAMMLGKAASAAESSPAESVSWSLFAILFSAVMGMLSTVRFWEEKSCGTLKSLLGLPHGVRSLFLSKLLPPVQIGFGLSCIFAASNLYWAHAQGLELNWVFSVVPAVLIFGWVLAVELAILVGCAIWMMRLIHRGVLTFPQLVLCPEGDVRAACPV